MTKAKAGSKESPIKCETSISCKATASLEAEVKQELGDVDKSLEELLDEAKANGETLDDDDKADTVCD